MDNCDEAWENFCDGISEWSLENHKQDDHKHIEEVEVVEPHNTPISTDIYISTQTKIIYLNKSIDLLRCFWQIPITTYSQPKKGVVKKQMKLSFLNNSEITQLHELLKHEVVVDEQIISRVLNSEGEIKKDM